MKMTFYTANCRGNEKNSLYPNRRMVDNEDDFLEVMAFDHVCGRRTLRSVWRMCALSSCRAAITGK